MKKTISFAVMHFSIAFTVAYVLTGNILVGGMIAILEPSINTVAYYFHEKFWSRARRLQRYATDSRMKTVSFAVIHFNVAFCVAYLLTGSVLVGGVMALIEPGINTVGYYFHERLWQKNLSGQRQCHCVG